MSMEFKLLLSWETLRLKNFRLSLNGWLSFGRQP